MEDWKIRLQEEYEQLKDRYEKLRAFNNKLGIQHILSENEEWCSRKERKARKKELYTIDLLKQQEKIMEEYLRILEIRIRLDDYE